MHGKPATIGRNVAPDELYKFIAVNGKSKFPSIHIVMRVRFQINRKKQHRYDNEYREDEKKQPVHINNMGKLCESYVFFIRRIIEFL